jgi:hypothetical protein
MGRCSEKTVIEQREISSERARLRLSDACRFAAFLKPSAGSRTMGKGLLLWILGIPIPVIILLYVFHVV